MTAGVAPPVVDAHEDVHVTGRRILATLVDALIFAGVYTLLAALFGTFTTEGFLYYRAEMPAILPNVLYGIGVVLYYVLMEGYLGQTVGKMLLRIKVVKEGTGEVPGLKAATIRTILRLVDGLASYLVAFVAIMVSEKRQRLGDMAAHTLVVHK